MNKRTAVEFTVASVLMLVLLVSLVPALKYSRAEVRDGERITDLAFTKHALELYFNDHNTYPLQAINTEFNYVVTSRDKAGAAGWYIESIVEHPEAYTSGFDAEAGRNFYYRIVTRDGVGYYQICGGEEVCIGS